MTRYYLNKLFGGARNAQRYEAIEPLPPYIAFAQQTTTQFSQMYPRWINIWAAELFNPNLHAP